MTMHKQVYHASINTTLDAILEVACTKAQLAAMCRQAKREGLNPSNWARHHLLRALPKRKKPATNEP